MIAMGETRDGRADLTNIELELYDTRLKQSGAEEADDMKFCKNAYIKPSCVPVSLVITFVTCVVLFPLVDLHDPHYTITNPCNDSCSYHLVESIPQGLSFNESLPFTLSTYAAWKSLLERAEKNTDLAAFYWTLRGQDVYQDPSDYEGEEIFRLLMNLNSTSIRIAQNSGTPDQLQDSAALAKAGRADVRSLNMSNWFQSGVMHTKLWVVDGRHFYIGSANMDWRSLTQVKELGIAVFDCECLARDVQKVFDLYWLMGKPRAELPHKRADWPDSLRTRYNATAPMAVRLNGTVMETYISSSPAEFCPLGRENDMSAIRSVIRSATKFVHIAVMDYLPTTLYTKPRRYWADIDNELRAAAFDRNITVRLLVSTWKSTPLDTIAYLRSLLDLNYALQTGSSIKIKFFKVPAFTPDQARIPFARVNHNKYMVTDRTAYIGTSNWVGDYFLSTAGAAIVLNKAAGSNGSTIVDQLSRVFWRDWTSSYAFPVQLSHGDGN